MRWVPPTWRGCMCVSLARRLADQVAAVVLTDDPEQERHLLGLVAGACNGLAVLVEAGLERGHAVDVGDFEGALDDRRLQLERVVGPDDQLLEVLADVGDDRLTLSVEVRRVELLLQYGQLGGRDLLLGLVRRGCGRLVALDVAVLLARTEHEPPGGCHQGQSQNGGECRCGPHAAVGVCHLRHILLVVGA